MGPWLPVKKPQNFPRRSQELNDFNENYIRLTTDRTSTDDFFLWRTLKTNFFIPFEKLSFYCTIYKNLSTFQTCLVILLKLLYTKTSICIHIYTLIMFTSPRKDMLTPTCIYICYTYIHTYIGIPTPTCMCIIAPKYLLLVTEEFMVTYSLKGNGGASSVMVINIKNSGGARSVVVIVVGNGHGDTSSNPGRDWLHFT